MAMRFAKETILETSGSHFQIQVSSIAKILSLVWFGSSTTVDDQLRNHFEDGLGMFIEGGIAVLFDSLTIINWSE